MGSLYARAFASQALLDAWAQVREAALADGGPDEAVTAFERDAVGRLDELAEALADGSWEPSPVVRVELPKPSGRGGAAHRDRWSGGAARWPGHH